MKHITTILTNTIEFEWEDGTKDSRYIPEWLFQEINKFLDDIQDLPYLKEGEE